MQDHPCAICEKMISLSDQCFWDSHTQLAFCSTACVAAPLLVTCPWCFAEPNDVCVGRSPHPTRVKAAAEHRKKLLATPIEELIERSSLGTPQAKYLRDHADKSVVERVLARADELQNVNVRHFRGRK